jgi:hypothetical protein
MPLHKIVFIISLVILTLLFASGSLAAGQTLMGLIASGLIALVWVLALRMPTRRWLPTTALVISVALSAGGIWFKAPAVLMIFTASLALLNWDLLSLGQNSAVELTPGFERSHIQWVLIALGSGLLLVVIGQLIVIRLPFILTLLITILALFSLDRIRIVIKK